MTEPTIQAHGARQPNGPTAAEVAATLLRQPFRALVLKWNYKSAVTSSLIRGAVFLVANLSAGLEAAAAASAAEFALRFCTAGYYGALTQAFGQVRPARHGTLAVVIGLPVLSHAMELALHVLRGTPNLGASVAASLTLTMASTVFSLFAMRRGLLVVGVAEAQSLGHDLRAIPAMCGEFARAAVTAMRRAGTAATVLLALLLAHAGKGELAAGGDDGPVRLFLDRAEPVLSSYAGRRHIEVVNPRFNARGWMTVATAFDAAHGLTWTVVAEGGSKYIREKVIGKALEIRGRLAKSPSLWTPWVEVVRRYARVNDIRVAVDTEAVSAVRVAGRSYLRVVYDYTQVNGVGVPANRRAPAWPPTPWQPQ